MKTSYSRRELYALGEPLGESATRLDAGRRVYGGGGGGIPIVSDVVDAVSDIGGGLVDAVRDVGGDVVESARGLTGDLAGGVEHAVETAANNPLETALLAAGAYYGLPGLYEGAAATDAALAGEGLSALDAGMGVYPTAGLSSAVGGSGAGLSALDAGMDVYPGTGSQPSAFLGLDQETANLVGLGDSTPAADSGIFGAGSDLNQFIGLEGANTPWAQAVTRYMNAGRQQQQGGGLSLMGALTGLGGIAGIKALLDADKGKYGVPGQQAYSGPLSQFKYSPAAFQPNRPDPNMFRPRGGVRTVADTYRPQMAAPVYRPYTPTYSPYVFADQTPDMQSSGLGAIFGFAEGGSTSNKPKLTAKAKLAKMDPWTRAQAELGNAAYMAQMPTATQTLPAPPQMGQLNMAHGGISDLGGYSDGGRMLKGPGDGMSDSIPATIGGKREARLADGEFVVPADVVSHLGNGSTDAGAKQLYKMMDRVRSARTGNKRQGKEINADKYTPA